MTNYIIRTKERNPGKEYGDDGSQHYPPPQLRDQVEITLQAGLPPATPAPPTTPGPTLLTVPVTTVNIRIPPGVSQPCTTLDICTQTISPLSHLAKNK